MTTEETRTRPLTLLGRVTIAPSFMRNAISNNWLPSSKNRLNGQDKGSRSLSQEWRECYNQARIIGSNIVSSLGSSFPRKLDLNASENKLIKVTFPSSIETSYLGIKGPVLSRPSICLDVEKFCIAGLGCWIAGLSSRTRSSRPLKMDMPLHDGALPHLWIREI